MQSDRRTADRQFSRSPLAGTRLRDQHRPVRPVTPRPHEASRAQPREVRAMIPADVGQAARRADVSLSLWSRCSCRPTGSSRCVMLGLLARLGLVLGDHRRQGRCSAAAPAPDGPRSRRCSGPASRWRSSTARSPSRPTIRMAALFVAAMREWKRSLRGPARARRSACRRASTRCIDVTIAREMERLEARLLFLATVGSAGALHRPVRHGLGHHEHLPGDRGVEEHLARRRGAGHRRGAVRHRARPDRRHSGGDRLQQALRATSAATPAGSKASPTSSPPSCRARSTSRS